MGSRRRSEGVCAVTDEFTSEEWDEMQEECEAIHLRRAEAIEAAVKNHSCYHFDVFGDYLVGRWVGVVEIIDELGDRHLTIMGSTNLEPWEALGLMRIMQP